MEIGPSVRIPMLPATTEPSRATSPPAEAVRTELPRDASVQQVERPAGPEDPRTDTGHHVSGDGIDRGITLDIETRKVVYQAIDQRTGEVLTQFPDPRYLKAYLDQMRALEDQSRGTSPLTRKLA